MLEVNLKPLGFGVSYHRALGTACGPLDSSVSNLWGLVFHIIGFWSDHQTLEYHQILESYTCKLHSFIHVKALITYSAVF